jgi:hypothetical protein
MEKVSGGYLKKHWTTKHENYPIREGFLYSSAPLAVKAEI